MSSIFLSPVTWDFCADINGNIAVANEPYSLAQDAACACRTAAGELWYDTTQGVPYFTDVLGKKISAAALRSLLVAAAKTVPGVTDAKVYFTSISGRAVSGQVQVYDTTGSMTAANF